MKVMFNTNLTSIENDCVYYTNKDSDQNTKLENDLVFILAGGELPTQFLEKSGIQITRKFGEALLKHEK
jgi:thioredoxin reductase